MTSMIGKWIKDYKKSFLPGDMSAGLTVGIMLVPQGMAYAMLAGLPAQYGLYASIFPILFYAFFGSSRQLSVGPVAMDSLLVASGVGAIAVAGSNEFISYAILLAMMVGIIQIIMGVFKMGFMVHFLSKPVIGGFTAAAAIIIGISQLKYLLGIHIPNGNVIETVQATFSHLNEINLYAFIIGLSAIAIILILKKSNFRIPSLLIVVLSGLAVTYYFHLDRLGVEVIGVIPQGLPTFSLPLIDWEAMQELLVISLTIAIIGFMEAFAIGKGIEGRHDDYKIDANQELFALGGSNLLGSLFSAFPVTGGFSRTAVNEEAGAQTNLAGLISAGIVVLVALYLTPYFYYLPKAVLAAIIMVAVFGLIEVSEIKRLYEVDKMDLGAYLLTFLLTLFFGIKVGIGAGVLFSLGMIIYRLAYPHMAILGSLPGTTVYRNVNRFDNINSPGEFLILRFDAPLFFANSDAFKNKITTTIASHPETKYVIIEASGIHHFDSTSAQMLVDLHKELSEEGIALYFSELKGPLRDSFSRYGLFNQIGKDHFYLTTGDAVKAIQGNENSINQYALQHMHTTH